MAGKKLRYLKREPWWREYHGEKVIVFGHYWRRAMISPSLSQDLLDPEEKSQIPPLFTEPYDTWLGPNKNCMCVDYSVGRRFWERHNCLQEGDTGSFLGAFQITDKNGSFSYKIIFDNGTEIVIPS